MKLKNTMYGENTDFFHNKSGEKNVIYSENHMKRKNTMYKENPDFFRHQSRQNTRLPACFERLNMSYEYEIGEMSIPTVYWNASGGSRYNSRRPISASYGADGAQSRI